LTDRLYYRDNDLQTFEATVVDCVTVDGRPHVVLDRTAFYPTSGGQPFDTGQLAGATVIEVIEREDGEIAHLVSAALAPGHRVSGTVDWPRRTDHRQQHSGQHVLSAAFDRLSGLATVSFHLGGDVSTIDLSREATPDDITGAETEANRIVWDDRPVHVRIVSAEEAAAMPLRKPPARSGDLRVIEVEDFDWSACGGTHVTRTGMIGIIAVTGWERFKGGTRVSFVCGGRALRSHRALRDVVSSATRALSVTPGELTPQIERLLAEGRETDRTIKMLQHELARHRAAELRQAAETIGAHRVVIRHDAIGDASAIKALAQAIVTDSDIVAVMVGTGQPAPVVVARGPGASADAGTLVKALTTALGGRGGGRTEMAQAGVPADSATIVKFLRQQFEA
jgi:alanyl-tRNA synthetase